ncbi:lipid II:glycine glycyltransferase FemX [Demequina aurantiaca]|uniref:lipid II:glycine glycyltransferase FemX n=1 Tax=Demequina aurantiaca TaxID=676200 RepID=UPI003D342019
MTSAPAQIEHVSDEQFEALVHGSGHRVPIEQSPAWDPYDAIVEGRTFWRRLAYSVDGQPQAVVALTEYTGRGFHYLWAKHGPIWIGDQTAQAELGLRKALRDYIAREAPHIAFARIHAKFPAPDLHELLQSVTYDRTVAIDLTRDLDDIFAAFSKRRRSGIRKALRDEGFVLQDESGLTREAFDELYRIYEETAERDGFGIYQADTYFSMLEGLGQHARVFVARRSDSGTADAPLEPGRAVAWVIVTTYEGAAVSYYAGASAEARGNNAVMLLRWHLMQMLKDEDVTSYDLMGVDSERAPTLKGVGDFKRQFGEESTVDGAWDLPVKRTRYRVLTALLRLKRALRR